MDDNQNKDLLQPEQNEEVQEVVQPDSQSGSSEGEKSIPYSRFKQVNDKAREAEQTVSDLRRELNEVKEAIAQRQETTGDEPTEEEVRAVDRLEAILKKRGTVVFKSDLEVNQRAETLNKLSDKYDGTNGYPKFDSVEVMEHATKNGYGKNYEAAYNDLHRDAIIQVEVGKAAKRQGVPESERATGQDRQSPFTEISPADIANMSPAEYEKHREKMKSAMKQSAINASKTY